MPKKPLLLVNLELSPPCKENYFYYLFRFSTCDEGSTHNNTLKIPLLFCKNMLTMIIMKGLGQQCLDWHFGCFSVCGQKWLVFACDTIIKKMTVLYFLYLVCFGYVKTQIAQIECFITCRFFCLYGGQKLFSPNASFVSVLASNARYILRGKSPSNTQINLYSNSYRKNRPCWCFA